MHHFWYNPRHGAPPDAGIRPILRVAFYRTDFGKEPVREWIRAFNSADRQAIGADIKTAQYGLRTPTADLRTARRRLSDLRRE
jgi:phage-related protein